MDCLESVIIVLLLSILGTMAIFAVMPFLFVFFDVVGAWYDALFDRLEAAADRFCRKRGWF